MAAKQGHIAHAVADAADVFKVPLFGMIGTLHEEIYPARGHELVAEYYADLFYGDAGNLLVTRVHDPVDPQDSAARAIRAVTEGKTLSTGGVDVAVRADSICVHSDTPNAQAVAEAVNAAIRPYMAQAAE